QVFPLIAEVTYLPVASFLCLVRADYCRKRASERERDRSLLPQKAGESHTHIHTYIYTHTHTHTHTYTHIHTHTQTHTHTHTHTHHSVCPVSDHTHTHTQPHAYTAKLTPLSGSQSGNPAYSARHIKARLGVRCTRQREAL